MVKCSAIVGFYNNQMLQNTIKSSTNDEDLLNVTIVCDDDNLVGAHTFILSIKKPNKCVQCDKFLSE